MLDAFGHLAHHDMTDLSPSTSAAETALAALAVLGRADEAALAAVVGSIPTAELKLVLNRQPAVRWVNGWWALDPAVAAERAAALEHSDLPRYRQLHERAITHFAARLRTGDPQVEREFIAAFDRLASRLLQDDPAAFITLVEAARDVPLADAADRQLRRYFEAVALAKADRYSEALAVLDELLAEPDLDVPVRGRALNSRAIYAYLTGQLQEAMSGYRASLALWRQLGNRLREGMALLNLGIIAYELQEYAQAEGHLAQATQCFESSGSAQQLASAQNELGLVYRDQGRWAEALDCFEKVAAQRRREGAQDSLGRALNNLGEVLLFLGRVSNAAGAFREALAAMQTRVFAVDAHLNLGLAQQVSGNLPGARAAFQTALDMALTIERRDILAQVHYRLGEVLRRMGEPAQALEQFRAGVGIIEAIREPLREEGLKISLLGRWQQVYEALVLHCLSLGRVTEAFEWAEHARARAFAEAIAAGDQEEVASAAEVQSRLPAGAALLCYFTTGVLAHDIPMLRALPANSARREHLLTPARTLLFALTPQTLTVRECPLDPNTLFTVSPRQRDRSRFLDAPVLGRLYQALLQPAQDVLHARQLYVIPHGPLHSVPFAALTDEQGRSLIETSAPPLAYAPSATVLAHQHLSAKRASSSGQCLAIGYGGMESEQSLRHAEAEARLVAALTEGEAWIGPAPKKDRLREAAGDRRWLHFACHGQFTPETPLESYLEIGAGERLTAREVMDGWRLCADVVVLSACQTGVSGILRGDEPMGLIRAFLRAGAYAVVVSQWPVEDLPTFLLMGRFYSELQLGSRPAAALPAAQRWLRELTGPEAQTTLAALAGADLFADTSELAPRLPPEARPFSQPRYWAAFVLVGRAGE
jgi:CHAT domain-containing protein/tetratricopeptide (TPR) repeat protein